MVKYERPEGDRRSSKPRYSSRRSFGGDRSRDRRDSGRGSRDRRDVEMTQVTCSECGNKCEVPFKPTTSKPLFCDACFAKKGGRSNSNRSSGRDLDIVNEKLDKIMKALKIE